MGNWGRRSTGASVEGHPRTDAGGTVSGLTQYVATLPDGPSYRALNSNRDDPPDRRFLSLYWDADPSWTGTTFGANGGRRRGVSG